MKVINKEFLEYFVLFICFIIFLAMIIWSSDTERKNYIKSLGSKEVIEDCLSEHPNICRTITTFKTDFKEKKNEFVQ